MASTGAPMSAGAAVEKEEAVASAVIANPHADLAEIMPSLPTAPGFPPYRLRRYGGFWHTDLYLKFIGASHACFKPRPTDVLLASFPKTGTTWLKALAFSALNRAAHPPSVGADHPLHRNSPHDLVRFLELANQDDDGLIYEEIPSPRLLATHVPYSLLPRGITGTEDGSGGRIVYVCRDPKDTFVSFWHYHEKTTATLQRMADVGGASAAMPTFEEAFELFCQGQSVAGPQWRHTLEYWEASRRSPDQVLFLRYEDMLLDPSGSLMKLAAFMACPFSPEEEAAGVVRDIVKLCSLGTLKGLEVNRRGSTMLGLKNEAFFRNGTVGDWSNCMTPAMAARLDGIVAEALQGSMLTFGASSKDEV
ncbi:cytosolic sulfotransferase 5-like [Triticum dicoccoides]|uniref:cytosolic sulfotransferase 5-like n=1 Tax=Triticum dicoccoides TaxID=85692 RepID=UPI0018910FEB|nr:cytosolic sulfotransferase 5-like [Triticum dicoccoides]